MQVCGRLAVTWKGRRIESELPARQGRLLFVFLVVGRSRPISRDELLEVLWPNPSPGGEASLRSLLSRLRRVLGADAVMGGETPGLHLPAEAFVDLEAAREALHRAEAAIAQSSWVEAWAPARVTLHTSARGFLPGHDVPWADAIRSELAEMRLRALECVAAAGLGLAGPELDAAERSGRRIVELAPFRESGHRLLIEALAARGNVAEALLAYDRLRMMLREEIGIPPSSELQALHARLLRL